MNRGSPSTRPIALQRRRLCVAGLGGLASVACVHARERQMPQADADSKAAHLVRFIPYVEWPAGTLSPGDPFVIAVDGDDAVLEALRRIAPTADVAGRSIVVQRHDDLQAGAAPPPTPHVALVAGDAATARRRMRHWLALPVLLVSGHPGGLRRGSAINFVRVDGRVRFEVSRSGAQRAGLVLSSRLLHVAQRVLAAR